MEVQPNKQNIKEVFNGTVYYIDFYQRQYKWTVEPVRKLISDIFYKFDTEYSRHEDEGEPIIDSVNDYGWYYLNTFVTNRINSRTYIVDGQQRLTTLSLILMKLRKMASSRGSKLEKFIDSRIVGITEYGQFYLMNHERQTDTLQDIYDNGVNAKPHDKSITAKNLVENYKAISSVLDCLLPDEQSYRFEAFILYLLNRVVLVQLDVEQADVPMVFEVINDRGVRLKPYEILKGKLLGQLDKEELQSHGYSDKWDNQMDCLSTLDFYKSDERNEFFVTYLRAKFANSPTEGKNIDANSYHRFIMNREELHLEHNKKGVVKFLTEDFVYYASLYYRIRKCKFDPDTEHRYLYFLSLNDQNRILMLIMSACKVNDANEEEKIEQISREFDRFYSLLQLQRAYNGNKMDTYAYAISKEIRNKDNISYRDIFDRQLIEALRDSCGNNELSLPWNYSLFKNTGYDTIDKRYLRYALARVELLICDNTNSKMRYSFKDLVQSKSVTFHIEHILANNTENIEMSPDEATFINERNRLGGLLLLKGKDNISVGNGSYEEKLKTYANTLYWNETLREDTYAHNLDLTSWITKENLDLHPIKDFRLEQIEERQKILFDIFGLIWNNKA